MCIELKIKAKHLALEPAIIRQEEAKLKKRIKHHRSSDQVSALSLGWKLNELTNHRRINVRNEARATHLARAYLAGKPYSFAEQKRKPETEVIFMSKIIPRIVDMVTKYGTSAQRHGDTKVTPAMIKQWAKL